MKKKLYETKKMLSIQNEGQLSQDDLKFITGGTTAALLSGSGTSSTSGDVCCDGTCVCKKDPIKKPTEAQLL